MATLTKANIIASVPDFNQNIEDRLITQHIVNAWKIDFADVLPKALLTEIENLNLTGEGNTELKAFYNDYVLQVWALRFYSRFLAFHGNNVSQFGVSTIYDMNTNPTDSATRAFMIKNIDRDCSVYITQMINAWIDANYTFDGVEYLQDDKYKGPSKEKRFGIRGIK